jgi:hypothetical protein
MRAPAGKLHLMGLPGFTRAIHLNQLREIRHQTKGKTKRVKQGYH